MLQTYIRGEKLLGENHTEFVSYSCKDRIGFSFATLILMFKKWMDLLSFRKAFSEVEGGVLTKSQPCVRYKVTHKALKQTVNKTRVSQ